MKSFIKTVNYIKYTKFNLKCNYSNTTTDKKNSLSYIQKDNRIDTNNQLIQKKTQSLQNVIDEYNRRWKKNITIEDYYNNFRNNSKK